MPTELMELLYRGDRAGALKIARERDLDVFEAAALGALETLIERCEEDGRRVGATSDDGWTPLHLAAFFGQLGAVKELLRRGAFVDARSTNGDVTPLHSAAVADNADVVAVLIAAGANVDATQASGHRPLDAARRNGNAAMVAMLEAAGAQPG